MPLFQYKCASCQAKFEAFSREDEPVTCVACGATAVKKEILAANQASRGCGGCQGCKGCH